LDETDEDKQAYYIEQANKEKAVEKRIDSEPNQC
jgi:hypothetical protein